MHDSNTVQGSNENSVYLPKRVWYMMIRQSRQTNPKGAEVSKQAKIKKNMKPIARKD